MRANDHSLIAQYGQWIVAAFLACVTIGATSAGGTAWIMSRNENVGQQNRSDVQRAFDQMQQEITEDRRTLNSQAIDLAKQGADLAALHDAATNLTKSIDQLTGIMSATNANLSQLAQEVKDMSEPTWAAKHR